MGGYYEAILAQTSSGSCDYASIAAMNCDQGAGVKDGLVAQKPACDMAATRDTVEQSQQAIIDGQKKAIADNDINCDSAETPSADPSTGGGNPAPASAPDETTPSPTTADGSAANGIAYKFAIVVSAAFAYFLF